MLRVLTREFPDTVPGILTARRIIAVSTRYPASREEADRHAIAGYPPPAQVAGGALQRDLPRPARLRRRGDAPAQQARGAAAGGRAGRFAPDRFIDAPPSMDLGRLANAYESDLLSLVMFQNDYVRHLIELGDGTRPRGSTISAGFSAPSAATGQLLGRSR